MATVLLFDIDGTLVLTGGAGRRAMEGAFVKAHNNAKAFEGVSFAGMTDRAIARHGLGAAAADDAIEHVLSVYLELLEKELAVADQYRILPGVMNLLASIENEPNLAIGLGTGNVKRGAYAKLTRGNIHHHFAFGGFGCDAENRTELIRAGAKRGAEALKRPLEECRVVVIGDTPKDVAAAKGIGAACVGVGTGSYTAATLRECGAEHAFDTLEHSDVREVLLRA